MPWSAELGDLDQSQFPMFGHLIPYADTIFNSRQIPTLLTELPRLPPDLLSNDFILGLRELCEFALSQPHRYLWFVGD